MYGAMPDFTLQDQNGRTARLADLRGKISVADVIFTRCAGECPVMTAHMQAIEKLLPKEAPVEFVSFTTDPAHDTPEILKTYALRYGADENRWMFLTGSKPALRGAIIDGLKLAAMDKEVSQQQNPEDLFVHSAKFVLIDGAGQIRGYFDGEADGAAAEVAAAIAQLEKER